MPCKCKRGACEVHKNLCAACCNVCERKGVGRPKAAAPAVAAAAGAANQALSDSSLSGEDTPPANELKRQRMHAGKGSKKNLRKRRKAFTSAAAAVALESDSSEFDDKEPVVGSSDGIKLLLSALKIPWSRHTTLPGEDKRRSGDKAAMSQVEWGRLVSAAG
jgi:hypothetical protein